MHMFVDAGKSFAPQRPPVVSGGHSSENILQAQGHEEARRSRDAQLVGVRIRLLGLFRIRNCIITNK